MTRFGKITMIVCDLDGTLVDSMGGFNRVAQEVLHAYYGVDPRIAAELYQRTSGLPFYYQLESLFPQDERNWQASQEFERLKCQGYAQKSLFQDVLKTLPSFRRAGYTLCVSSNNHESNVLAKLSAQAHLFDEILGYREGFLKGRRHFQFLQKKYRVAAKDILFVGDSLNDARTSQENGVAFVARLGTFTAKDFQTLNVAVTIRDFYELYHHLEGQSFATRRIGSR